MDYALIISYSFDEDVVVYLFPTEEEAVSALRGSYEKELRIDTEENGWNSVGEISESGLYAKITIPFADHEDVTEFRVGNIYHRKQIIGLMGKGD